MPTRNTRSQTRRRQTIARGANAAALLRKSIRADFAERGIRPQCALCPATPLPSLVDIDHVTPIYKGGEDVASNLQVLCKPCHKLKTHSDCGYTTTPF
ncbi:HNH endonuclease signature motif containing protein [Streptomyces avermitilis]|uniref:HNH endonuclease signature motif containing protein n=1 Tax=Streptomyces avermitilis TaxID=33903 RepID=UPI00381EEFB6